MRRIRYVCAALLCAAVATVVSAAPGGVPGPPAGKGQAGKGIGPQVAKLAKGGVHGPQLVGQIKVLQAAKGIGAVNGQGKGQGMKGGPQGKGKQ